MTKWLLSLFWLFALLNPFYKKYDYGGGWPLVIIVAILVPILIVWHWHKKREKNYQEEISLLIFIVAVAISFLFSQTKNIGFSEVIAFTSVPALYLNLANQKIDWQSFFFKTITIATIFAIAIGFYFYVFQAEPRMFGPFFNLDYHANKWPNAFALFLLMAWPIFLSVIKKPKKLIIPLTLVFTALLLTFSRGALIVLAGQVVLLLLLNIKKIRFRPIIITLLIALFSFGLFTSINQLRSNEYQTIDLSEKINFENQEALTSKQERQDFWLGAIELAKEKPLFGWGPFSFRYAYQPIQKTLLGISDHPHNFFLKIAAENGLIATAALLFFLITLALKLLKHRHDLTIQLISISIAGALAHNLIDYNFNFLANWLLFWLLLAIGRSHTIKDFTANKAPINAFVISAIAAGFTVSAYLSPQILYPRNYYLDQADQNHSLSALETQLTLNPLDPQAHYLEGVIKDCSECFQAALKLSPLNDFNYHRDYLRSLIKLHDNQGVREHLAFSLPILNQYFQFVQNNIHFTAYSNQVETAADYIDLILNDADWAIGHEEKTALLDKKITMLETAIKYRQAKTF